MLFYFSSCLCMSIFKIIALEPLLNRSDFLGSFGSILSPNFAPFSESNLPISRCLVFLLPPTTRCLTAWCCNSRDRMISLPCFFFFIGLCVFFGLCSFALIVEGCNCPFKNNNYYFLSHPAKTITCVGALASSFRLCLANVLT